MQAELVYPFMQRPAGSRAGQLNVAGGGVILAVIAVAILAIVAFGGVHVSGGIDVGRDNRGRFQSRK